LSSAPLQAHTKRAAPRALRTQCCVASSTSSDDDSNSSDEDSNSTDEDKDVLCSNAGAASQPLLGLMEVVNLQQFDGSWKLKDAAHLTAVPLDGLSAANPAKGEAAWATALVLVLLERKFGEQREEWELLATKGRAFLVGCGEQPEEMLAKARLTLDSHSHFTISRHVASKDQKMLPCIQRHVKSHHQLPQLCRQKQKPGSGYRHQPPPPRPQKPKHRST
ncbi:hypothetical protein O3P69_014943, partial [Scylla paramamosain]